MTTLVDHLQSSTKIVAISSLSICLHASFFWYISHLASRYSDTNFKNFTPIHLEVQTTPPLEVKESIPEALKAPIRKQIKTIKKAPKTDSLKPTKKAVKPIQGLPPEALSKQGAGIAVPIGNTTMTGDEGKRLKAEDVNALPPGQDLGTQPQLIRSSVETPEYTQEALDNNIVGTFAINVYVDESGIVTKAELQRKIGYGMDERVIAAAKKVHFVPGKDRYGKEIGEWTEIKFRLEIP